MEKLKHSKDQMGREVRFNFPPKRIVSLVPSQTELLFDLGLGDRVVGITNFCIHPEEACKETPKIGGTKKFKFDRIDALQPDLIIGNKEENYREGIEQLAEKYPVWMSDILTLGDALEMIRSVGEITGKGEEALNMAGKIEGSFARLKRTDEKQKALYLIWRKPYMGVGAGTFIDEMLKVSGFENVLAHHARYPELSAEEIRELAPEVILLSSEPYPFKEKHMEEFRELCPAARIEIVDGEMFSWYGSRLLKSANYFTKLKEETF